nr:hypothetical protein [Beutenbergia cavernae]
MRASALGATWTLGTLSAVRRSAPGGERRWARTNYAGGEVSLLGGLALAAGAGAAAASVGGRPGVAGTLAAAAGGGFGALDDLVEDPAESSTKGLRGHLGALARGRVTTGGAKLLGISAASIVAAAIATRGGLRDASTRPMAVRALDVATSGALVAGTANLLNLLDLRPGRALKAAALAATPVALTNGPGAELAAGVVGSSLAALPTDLAETTMLGDTGANAVGAVLGTSLALTRSPWLRGAALAGVVALTLASERVSFSRVIARTPVLREADAWGRLERA